MVPKSTLLCFLLLLFSTMSWGQQITGRFSGLAAQYVVLQGFDGLQTYRIDSVQADAQGAFTLTYRVQDYGMGIIQSADKQSLIVLLSNENTALQGAALGRLETLRYTEGEQNKAFAKYAVEQPKREQALNAWKYLAAAYRGDSLFAVHELPNRSIEQEISRLHAEEQQFLGRLPERSYVKWFLPMRKLVSNVPVVAQYRPEDIPATKAALQAIDYADPRLYKSGLFREAIDNHVLFLENTSGALDKVFADLQEFIDTMVAQLQTDEGKFNKVTQHLFNLLEQRSLFAASEYLSLKVLNQQSCIVNADLAKQLEGYRKMKVGNKAPDIAFTEATYPAEGQQGGTLYGIKSDYTLVVFAAGWCTHCQQELPKLEKQYASWKQSGVEVVLVSLDETPAAFAAFAGKFPFISTTDYQKWDGKAVTDYHVFGTPTMFLLDKEKTILLRPNSVEHLNAWIANKIQ